MTNRPSLRVLFALFQGGGNIPLILPIVKAMVERGHDVRVMPSPGIRARRIELSESLLRRITEAGAQRIDFNVPEVDPYTNLPPIRGIINGWTPPSGAGGGSPIRWLGGSSIPAAAREAQTLVWSCAWATNVAEELRRKPADVIVADYLLLGAMAAGEALDVPFVALSHNLPPPIRAGSPPHGPGFGPASWPLDSLRDGTWWWLYDRAWRRDGSGHLNLARAQLGLSLLKSPLEQYHRAAKLLMLGHEEFELPLRRKPANLFYVGTPIDDREVADDAWASPWPDTDKRPLILLALSTLSQGQGPLMKRAVEAVGGLPVRCYVTLGPSLNAGDYDAPENTVMAPFAPHTAVLKHASAMVTQCGLGSISKALALGVPVVGLPILADQHDNAARAEHLGAGIRLNREPSVAEIRAAVGRVVTDGRYKLAAERYAKSIWGISPETIAAEQIELAAQTARTPTK